YGLKTLNKNILSVSVAAALLAGTSIANADTTVSGFVDVIYTVTNDGQAAAKPASGTNGAENKFLATGEIDIVSTVKGATVRLDLDVSMTANQLVNGGTASNNAEIEQAHIAVPIGGVTLIAGVFNNPIGYEAEDAPDLDFTTHNMIYDILDNQTAAVRGNNLAGAALTGAIGPVTLTGAFINDLGLAAEENSVALIANITVASNLDLELGYVTQDDQKVGGAATTAGDVLDFNAVFSTSAFAVGLDYMTFDNVLDDAIVVWGGVNVGPVNLKVRFETVSGSGAGAKDAEQTTFYASYPLAANSSVALEIKDGDVADSGLGAILVSSVEGSLVTLEFIGTF
ncbi:MAG: porin, partial [Gammaproteobacteria bacterium]|nr:porin [Gammaproteobacteria bacterium]